MKFWIGIAFALAGVAILCGLGSWQVQRGEWKDALIADIEAKQVGDVDLLEYLDNADAGFRRGYMDGRFDYAATLMTKPRNMDGNIGYWIVTPLVHENGERVWVNRGWVPDGSQSDVLSMDVIDQPVRVYGSLREHGALTDYEPVKAGGQWVLFARMITPPDHAALVAAPLQASIRNEHARYAMFWFTMASILFCFVAFFVGRRLFFEEGV